MEPTYTYHAYQDGAFLGLLNNVTSEFNYSHQLNQAGCSLEVELTVSPDDVSAAEDVDYLITGGNDFLVNEDNDFLITRLDYNLGNYPINLGNRIIVYRHDTNYPDGFVAFDGVISSWALDYANSIIKIIILSHGVFLDNYILNTEQDLSVIQESYDNSIQLTINDPAISPDSVAQTFQIGTAVDISSIDINLYSADTTKTCLVLFELVEGTPTNPGSTLISQTRNLYNNTASFINFSFSPAVSISASTNYYFSISAVGALTSSYTNTNISYQNSSVYASGSYYDNIDGAGWTIRTRDLAFRVNTTTGSVAGNFLNTDPADLAKIALDIFNSQGGIVTYTDSTIENSNLSVDYNFKVGTIWEALKKAYELAPSNYILFVEPSDNLVYLKARSTEPDHIFIYKKHLADLDLEYTIDGLKNTVYFSGGDTGAGENLFIVRSNLLSKQTYGQWLARESDNRVTQTETANLISTALLSRQSTPSFRTKIIIPSATYNIETVSLGDMVTFAGFNNLIDNLLLCVVGLKRDPYSIEIALGTNYPRQSQRIEKLQRDLIYQQTQNNPEVAS